MLNTDVDMRHVSGEVGCNVQGVIITVIPRRQHPVELAGGR